MKILDSGHSYLLDCLDGDTKISLDFVKRVGPNYPRNKDAHTGTTTQEVLRALIDRIKYVQMQKQWHENVLVLQCLRMALWLLESRAHKARNEMFNRSPIGIEDLKTCSTCLHIDCSKHGII